jgi:hypothetical protein
MLNLSRVNGVPEHLCQPSRTPQTLHNQSWDPSLETFQQLQARTRLSFSREDEFWEEKVAQKVDACVMQTLDPELNNMWSPSRQTETIHDYRPTSRLSNLGPQANSQPLVNSPRRFTLFPDDLEGDQGSEGALRAL